jgi:porin
MRVSVAFRSVLLSFTALALTAGVARAEVEYDAVLTTDLLDNTSGGLRQGARLMGNLDLSAAWTGDNGWEGFAYVLADAGGGFSETYSGDAQVVSNIDAPAGTRLFEAWVRKTGGDGRWSLSGGLINLNGMFDVQEAGTLFLGASHGIGPDYSQSGPSIFPFSALGVVGEWQASDTLRLRAGLFDGVVGDPKHQTSFIGVKLDEDEGAHWVVEAEQGFDGGYLKLGAWTYTAPAERLDGTGLSRGNSGYYAQVKYDLYRPDPDSDRGVAGWVRVGAANKDVQPIEAYAGGGLVWTAPFKGRDADAVGTAVAHARFGRPYAQSLGADLKPETIYEMSYRYALSDSLSVQPDIQYISHPSGDAGTQDALVVGLRLRLGLAQIMPGR